MLHLRDAERLRPRLHPGQGRLGRRPPLPTAVRLAERPQGHELGAGPVATPHPRPVGQKWKKKA